MFKSSSTIDFTGTTFIVMFCNVSQSVSNITEASLYSSEVSSIPRQQVTYSSIISSGRKVITVPPVTVSTGTTFNAVALIAEDAGLVTGIPGSFIVAKYQFSPVTASASDQVRILFGSIILDYEPA